MNRDVIEFSIQQLERLQRFNEQHYSAPFSMTYWANKAESHPLDVAEPVDCGFSGCFMGWAAHQQWFDQFGLKLRLRSVIISPTANANVALMVEGEVNEHTLRNPHDYAITRVEQLFGISDKALEFIILPDQYDMPGDQITPGVVADRLRRLLALGDDAFVDDMTERLEEYKGESEDDED